VIIGEAEYSSYGKEAATKTRPRDIEAVGNRVTGRNKSLLTRATV
jgi:hypothetical protein